MNFWALATAALVVDLPLAGVARANQARLRYPLSVGPCLAILLVWGIGPALVVQAIAVGLAAGLQFSRPLRAVQLVGGYLGGVAVAALALAYLPRGPEDPVVLVGAWTLFAFVYLVIVRAVLSGRGPGDTWRTTRAELLLVAAACLLVLPVLTSVRGWWSLLAVSPMLLHNLLTRGHLRQLGRATRDSVTGALTRVGLAEQVAELTLYDRVRAPRPFALAMLGSDSVLAIRADLGRETYETVVAVTVRNLWREFDPARVGRLPGEGLVVVMPGVTGTAAVAEAARARALLDLPIEIDGVPFTTASSCGVVFSPEHGRDVDTLLERLGQATVEARRAGELVRVFVPAEAAATDRRIALLAELHAALRDPARHNEIGVLYQPQVALDTRELVGVEALFRWTHHAWGPVPTEELIAAIETSEVMRLLTRHVLRTAVAQARAWNRAGLRLRVAVNVSARDLHDASFVDEVAAQPLAPGQLTIEVTERTATGEDARVVRAARRIVDLGVGLSIDDFGTGQAAMRQLRALPVTEVKIDRLYVSRMLIDPSDRAIVTGVHALAEALGLHVVAEGVEDSATVDALAELPGVIAQGYHFGKPMPPEGIVALSREHPSPRRVASRKQSVRIRP